MCVLRDSKWSVWVSTQSGQSLCFPNEGAFNHWLPIERDRESRDFRVKNGGFLSKPLDSGKTLLDISANTGQIYMGFEAETS